MTRQSPYSIDGMADPSRILRAQGCLLGQLAGDSLGSLVEFQGPDEILRSYPGGVRELADGGPFGLLAGQPTDDSELALLLARMLVVRGAYDADAALREYRFWLDSEPFDCGGTIGSALRGEVDEDSQANGALMRISPLGIFGARFPEGVADWARRDAELTHPHPVCVQVNELFAMAVADAVRCASSPEELYRKIAFWAESREVDPSVRAAVQNARDEPPGDYLSQMGWVLIAFQNALWQLLHAASPEKGVVDTVMRGGDTDTNAAICGVLLGAVHGREAVPGRWVERILDCRPAAENPKAGCPRPECFWPADALDLAERLVSHPVNP